MSEPRAIPPRDETRIPSADEPRADAITSEPAIPLGPLDSSPDSLANLLKGSAKPTDDAATVISKASPQPLSAEDAFASGLCGRLLAHFELIEPIGVGGMAAVLRARDTKLDRQVALKILPPEMAADPENVRRFHQEARSAAKLDHETIARVFFCGEDQNLHFIAFEFVEGENLRILLGKRGRLPAAEAILYLHQIATGLAHAASRGVVHRDIKPSNIIITPDGRAKLVDMGLARCLEPTRDDGLTQSGVTLGTFDYISPEQALEPRDADVRSDIYSLGCTFYHVLTGQPPVPEGTAAKKLHHHNQVKPVDPRQLAPDVPDVVASILGRMMAKRPEDRYQMSEQLVQHLLLAARELGVNPEVSEGLLLPVETVSQGLPAGRPLLLAGLAALAVVCLILFTNPNDKTPQPESVVRIHRTDKGSLNRTDKGSLSRTEANDLSKDKLADKSGEKSGKSNSVSPAPIARPPASDRMSYEDANLPEPELTPKQSAHSQPKTSFSRVTSTQVKPAKLKEVGAEFNEPAPPLDGQ